MAIPFAAMRAATWEGASPLPNPPRPNLSGWIASRKVAPASRPMPHGGGRSVAGVSLAGGSWIVGPDGADPRRVCPRQTASDLSPYPAPHEAGDLGADHWQARASESRWLASSGLSFPIRPRRFRAHSCGEKTADPAAHVRASVRISRGARACPHHWRGEGAWPATTSP